jgi:RNA polymerase sigma factor (sigma-70 family)
MHSKENLENTTSKTLKDYESLIKTLAKVEYSRISNNYLIDFSELVNIGTLAVHTVITTHKNYEHNVTYISTAIKWAIRNEMRRRYRWYLFKSEPTELEHEENDSKYAKEELREAIYETILSMDELMEGENPAQIRDNSCTPEENYEFGELSRAIRTAMENLPEREKVFLETRFFKGKKLKDMADEYNISQSRISRILQSALDKLKEELVKGDYV